jgi:hypothetical protein
MTTATGKPVDRILPTFVNQQACRWSRPISRARAIGRA